MPRLDREYAIKLERARRVAERRLLEEAEESPAFRGRFEEIFEEEKAEIPRGKHDGKRRSGPEPGRKKERRRVTRGLA